MPPYQSFVMKGQEFLSSDVASTSGISLPTGINLEEDDVDRVCLVLKGIILEYSDIEMNYGDA